MKMWKCKTSVEILRTGNVNWWNKKKIYWFPKQACPAYIPELFMKTVFQQNLFR